MSFIRIFECASMSFMTPAMLHPVTSFAYLHRGPHSFLPRPAIVIVAINYNRCAVRCGLLTASGTVMLLVQLQCCIVAVVLFGNEFRVHNLLLRGFFESFAGRDF
mmetsp:Transcript_15802/g.40617  ORF Transcript_15802/g.40617 Transcript_15802/m.40617 type:complete len:105 (-) Transcript_15802:1637-1951(-)